MDEDRALYPVGRAGRGEPIPVITISAGKGGVGKTALASNLSRLVSWSGANVLLVDLDMYNRGATTLIADVVTSEHATLADLLHYAPKDRVPELADAVKKANLITWDTSPPHFYLLPSTRYNQQVLGIEYEHDVATLKQFLKALLSELVQQHDLQCIVMDCRAGPEPLFLAAAGLSTDTLLVTEADIVTWAGSMNLFNYAYRFYRNDAETLLNFQFVLNRIPDTYDEAELEQVYQRRLSSFLKGRRILATIPFDHDLFRSFTMDAFFVDEHPYAVFCRRVAGIADELFAATHPELLSDKARALACARGPTPRPPSAWRRSFLARLFP